MALVQVYPALAQAWQARLLKRRQGVHTPEPDLEEFGVPEGSRLPFPVRVLHGLVGKCGEALPLPREVRWFWEHDAWRIEGGKRGHSGHCNIFFLWGEEGFDIWYQCLASGGVKRLYGTIFFDYEACEWQTHVLLDRSQESYAAVKAKHELTCFKILNPDQFAIIQPDGELTFHNNLTILRRHWRKKYWERDQSNGWTRMDFILRWLRDTNRRTVRSVVVDPRRMDDKSVFNMWQGFLAESLPRVDEVLIPDLIAPITKHHSDVVAAGVHAQAEWVLDYLANLVQRPWQPTQVAIFLSGGVDCGKGIVFDFMGECVLGARSSAKVESIEHTNNLASKVMCQFDEPGCLSNLSPRLRSAMAADTVVYDTKGKGVMHVANLVNYVIGIDGDCSGLERSLRAGVFHCDNKYTGDTAYKLKLGKHLQHPEAGRAFYQYLMGRDLSAYPRNFKNSCP